MERETSSGEQGLADLCREFASEKAELVDRHEREVSPSGTMTHLHTSFHKHALYHFSKFCFFVIQKKHLLLKEMFLPEHFTKMYTMAYFCLFISYGARASREKKFFGQDKLC